MIDPSMPHVSNRPTRAGRTIGDPVDTLAPETRRLYASDWARFVAWCRQRRHAALPASVATLTTYLLETAPGVGRGTLNRRRSAIATIHRQQHLPIPLLPKEVQATLRAATRPPARRLPCLTAENCVQMAVAAPRDLAGLRDRALLLLVAATMRLRGRRHGAAAGPSNDAAPVDAIQRRTLFALVVEQVQFVDSGMVLLLRRHSEQNSPNCCLTVARLGGAACPVRALEDWLRASETIYGPVFRKVDRWGNVEHTPLGSSSWQAILARRALAPRRAAPPAGAAR